MTAALVQAWKGRTHLRKRRLAAIGATLVLAAGTGAYAASAGHGGLPLAATLLAFVALMAPYLLIISSSFARDLSVWLRAERWRGLVALVVYVNAIYLVYALVTGCFRFEAWGRLFAFVAVPSLLVASVRPSDATAPRWQDWLAVIAIWIPFDSGLLTHIWAWPEGEGAYILNTALAVTLATILFVGYRGVRGIGVRFSINRQEALVGLACLAGFIAIALPFGLATGFLAFNPRLELARVLAAPLGILLFVGLPEELLFRGLVQNFLQRQLGRPWLALVIASVFFGLTHYNNGPAPDWRYLFLATVAGLAYGFTYMRSRSLLAPALVHTAVDTIWMLLLHVTGWE